MKAYGGDSHTPHYELMKGALLAGKYVCTEKTMTGSLYEVAKQAFHVLEIICKMERSSESGVFESGIPPAVSRN